MISRKDNGQAGCLTATSSKGGWTNDGPEASDGLRLEGVCFIPTGRTLPAISLIDLHAPAGSIVAILGGAGSGKVCVGWGGGRVGREGRRGRVWRSIVSIVSGQASGHVGK